MQVLAFLFAHLIMPKTAGQRRRRRNQRARRRANITEVNGDDGRPVIFTATERCTNEPVQFNHDTCTKWFRAIGPFFESSGSFAMPKLIAAARMHTYYRFLDLSFEFVRVGNGPLTLEAGVTDNYEAALDYYNNRPVPVGFTVGQDRLAVKAPNFWENPDGKPAWRRVSDPSRLCCRHLLFEATYGGYPLDKDTKCGFHVVAHYRVEFIGTATPQYALSSTNWPGFAAMEAKTELPMEG